LGTSLPLVRSGCFLLTPTVLLSLYAILFSLLLQKLPVAVLPPIRLGENPCIPVSSLREFLTGVDAAPLKCLVLLAGKGAGRYHLGICSGEGFAAQHLNSWGSSGSRS